MAATLPDLDGRREGLLRVACRSSWCYPEGTMVKPFTFKSGALAATLSVEEMARKYKVSAKELNEIRAFVEAYARKQPTKTRSDSSGRRRLVKRSPSRSTSSRTHSK